MKKYKNVNQIIECFALNCDLLLFGLLIVFMSKSGKYCRVPELLRLESDGNLGGSEEKLDNNNLNESPSNRFPETIN